MCVSVCVEAVWFEVLMLFPLEPFHSGSSQLQYHLLPMTSLATATSMDSPQHTCFESAATEHGYDAIKTAVGIIR